MNYGLFLWLYHLSHRAVWLDRLIVFVADKADKIVLVSAILFFAVLFIKGKEWKHYRFVVWVREVAMVTTSVVAAWIIAEIIKVLVKAPRPFIVFPQNTPLFLHGGYDSFPSGHATVFFALATIMYEYHKGAGIVFFFLALLIALSRVIAGIHFPIDIAVGAIIGIIIGRLVFLPARKIFKAA